MKYTLAIGNALALVATIGINYFSNSGMMNGNTMRTISDRYANYFTPAGYAFSIWGLIYLGLFGFVVYSFRSDQPKTHQPFLKIGGWFIISCIANSLWVVTWLYDQLGLSVLLMTLLFVSLFKIIQNLGINGLQKHTIKMRLLVHWPFAIYFGWITVAFIANVAAFLTKTGWGRWGISEVAWTVTMVCIAGLLNALVVWAKKLYLFGLVGVWAVLAIAVANRSGAGHELVVYTSYSVAALLVGFIVVSMFKGKSAGY